MLPSMSKDTSLLKYISHAAKLHSFPTSQIQTPPYYGKVSLSLQNFIPYLPLKYSTTLGPIDIILHTLPHYVLRTPLH